MIILAGICGFIVGFWVCFKLGTNAETFWDEDDRG